MQEMDLTHRALSWIMCKQSNLTHKLQLAVIEALVSEQLLQESHDLTGAILVCLWQVDVAQIQH
jgi:hypothetical protein